MTRRGFSLLELLLVIALFVIISGLSLPFLISYQRSVILNQDFNKVVNQIRRAEALASGGKEDAAWSFRVEQNVAYLYKGQDFGARDQNFDEVVKLSSILGFSGVTEFNFDNLTGETQDSGVLEISLDGDVKTISVSPEGVVTF